MKRLVVTVLILIACACTIAACESLVGGSGNTDATLGDGVTTGVSVDTTAAVATTNMTGLSGDEARFGQALDFDGMVIRVDAPIEDEGAWATEGNRAWAALVTIQNNRSEEFLFHMLDYQFIDAEGTIYDSTGATDKQMLGTGTLAPGAQVQGYLAVELPAAASPVQVKFEPYIPVEKWVAYWR
jgi:hypothetical protein